MLINKTQKKRELLTSLTFFPGIAKHPIGLNEYRAHAIGVNIYFYSCLFFQFGDFGKNKN